MLSNELKGLKKQLSQLLQKNEHDNELIEALMVGLYSSFMCLLLNICK